MNRHLQRAVPAYLVLLLILAALGAHNQARLDRELALMEAREIARTEIVELRARAAAIQGPLAVSSWAQDHGMVPAPEIETLRHVMPFPAPEPERDETGLEVRTVWR